MNGHAERLSPVDASFLALESPQAHMHVGWSAICSPPAAGERPTIAALRARAAGRLAAVPRCRQRLLEAPLGLGEPLWVDDPEFDLAAHVVALSEPDDVVSLERFARLRAALLSQPLPRERPLWQIAVIPRLEDGRLAVVGRVHHAMADGTGALIVAMLMLDAESEAPAEAVAPWSAEPAPSAARRGLDPLVHGVERATRAARELTRAAVRPRSSARSAIRDAARIGRALAEDLLPPGPDSRLNVPTGPRRMLLGYRAPLDELNAGRREGATLNDAGLAVVAGALRSLALERGEAARPLKALIPVDVRRREDHGGLGNRVSMAAIWLPLELASPAARLERVRSQTERFQRDGRPAGTQALLSMLGLLPGALRGVVVRAGASSCAFNLTVSNVRGPRRALWMLGARIDEIYPVIPLTEQQTLSIGMLSYRGHLHFGLHSDPDALPHATRLPDLLAREVRRLTPSASRGVPEAAARRVPAVSQGERQ